MPKLEIDGQTIEVEDGINLIQAAERLGIEIPHYCYHPGLSIAGNCRMCLVEIEKIPKLQIACNTRVGEGMVVRTRSDRVAHAREAVLEFLLINHPIDCPICDQAGECKLQDYYMDYDRRESRFALEEKVEKRKALDIGPRIMLDQERCILCTRCTRFLDEVTKTSELGVFERGDHCRIDLFPERRLDNPYSMNVVDICPVGALTSKDFRFRARVWYLDHTPSVCPTCATGCNIDIHHRRSEMFRFRPRRNDEVNRFWMCDEGRLSYKRHQGEGRLLEPVVREGEGWQVRYWDDVVGTVAARLRSIVAEDGGGAVAGVVSAQATTEEAFLFERLLHDDLGGHVSGFHWSPPDAFRDDFLVDGDKNPNTAGLNALGLPAVIPPELTGAVKSGAVRALVLLRTDFPAAFDDALVAALEEKVECLVVLDTHYHATAELADVLLPVGSFAETDGTFINRSGRVQRVRPAFAPPANARPAWEVLSELRSRLGHSSAPLAASAVFDEIAAAVPAFRDVGYEKIGTLGVSIAAASGT
jgi:NADH-quinone oxidoreductase subunit G